MRALLLPEENLSASTSSDMKSPHNINIQDEMGNIAEATTRPRESYECPDCVKLKATVKRLQKTVSYLKKRRYQLISRIQKVIETFSQRISGHSFFRLSSQRPRQMPF